MKSVIEKLSNRINVADLVYYDRVVARALRDKDFQNADWLQAEKLAFRVLENIENSVFRFDETEIDGVIERPVILCGQILWSVAQRKYKIQNQFSDLQDSIFIALKASTAFMYSGNIASAYAVIRTGEKWISQDSDFNMFFDLLKAIYHFPDLEHPSQKTKDASYAVIQYFNQLMDIHASELKFKNKPNPPEISDYLLAHLGMDTVHQLPISIGSLAYSFQTSIEWLTKHLTVHALDRYWGVTSSTSEYRNALKLFGPHFVFPSQNAAFRHLSTVERNTNVIVTYPTSAGKTFIGEVLAIEPLLQKRSGLCVILVPLRVLVTQHKENEQLRNRLEQLGIRFVIAMGGYMDDFPTISLNERTFMVATPEAFDYAWRNHPVLKSALTSVTVDEFQLIEQGARGVNLECLCANFLDMKENGSLTRIIILSAVVDDTKALQTWLKVPDSAVLKTRWVPTQKRLEIQTKTNKAIFYPYPFENTSEQLTDTLEWPFYSGVTSLPEGVQRFSQQKHIETQVNQSIGKLAISTSQLFDGGVLVVCRTRISSRNIAREILDLLEIKQDTLLLPETERLRSILIDLLVHKFPYYRTLLDAINKRVCYHNAGLPTEIREKLELLTQQEYFRIVVSTTTLAEGVNLPFRSVIMESWVWGKDTTFKPLLIRNIAGRAGRAGYYVEGDTIFADNVYSQVEMDSQHYVNSSLLTDVVALDSSLLSVNSDIIESNRQNEYIQVDGKTEDLKPYDLALNLDIFGRLQSFLAEHIRDLGSLNKVEDFVDRLYIAFVSPDLRRVLIEQLETVIEQQINRSTNLLMVKNSPVRLTNLGEIAITTGISVESAAKIADRLTDLTPDRSPIGKTIVRKLDLSWNEWIGPVFDQFKDLHEIRVGWLRAKEQRSTPVNELNIELVRWGWYSGWSMPAILWMAKYRSKAKKQDWIWPLNSSKQSLMIEGEILELERFCEAWFGYSWNWVLNSISRIASSPEITLKYQIEFQKIARQLKYGVCGNLALDILINTRGFPGAREHAQILNLWANNSELNISSLSDLLNTGKLPAAQELASVILDSSGVSISTMDIEMASRICIWLENYELSPDQHNA